MSLADGPIVIWAVLDDGATCALDYDPETVADDIAGLLLPVANDSGVVSAPAATIEIVPARTVLLPWRHGPNCAARDSLVPYVFSVLVSGTDHYGPIQPYNISLLGGTPIERKKAECDARLRAEGWRLL